MKRIKTVFKFGFIITFMTFGVACSAPTPLLPTIPGSQKSYQMAMAQKNDKKPRRPASNDPGDLAQFALKGDFKGRNENKDACSLSVKGWGNDGPAVMKEYHEFKVSDFDKLIRTQFWAKTVEREKNKFKSKFVLIGNRFVVKSHKEGEKTISVLNPNLQTDNERLVLTVFLDDDQQTILGYTLLTEVNKERSEFSCQLKPIQ